MCSSHTKGENQLVDLYIAKTLLTCILLKNPPSVLPPWAYTFLLFWRTCLHSTGVFYLLKDLISLGRGDFLTYSRNRYILEQMLLTQKLSKASDSELFLRTPQYQQMECYPDLGKSILLDFSSMQRTCHLKTHVLISYQSRTWTLSLPWRPALHHRKGSSQRWAAGQCPCTYLHQWRDTPYHPSHLALSPLLVFAPHSRACQEEQASTKFSRVGDSTYLYY